MSTMALRRGASSVTLWLGLLACAGVLALLIAGIAKTLKHVKPVTAKAPPVSAVVWGDRVYFTPPPLARWLKQHGWSYTAWAHRHAPANHLLKGHKAG